MATLRENLAAYDAYYTDSTRWVQNARSLSSRECGCMDEAVDKITSNVRERATLRAYLRKRIVALYPRLELATAADHRIIVRFNDDPDTDFSRVKAVISDAINEEKRR